MITPDGVQELLVKHLRAVMADENLSPALDDTLSSVGELDSIDLIDLASRLELELGLPHQSIPSVVLESYKKHTLRFISLDLYRFAVCEARI